LSLEQAVEKQKGSLHLRDNARKSVLCLFSINQLHTRAVLWTKFEFDQRLEFANWVFHLLRARLDKRPRIKQ
jgi:hypothetical protein